MRWRTAALSAERSVRWTCRTVAAVALCTRPSSMSVYRRSMWWVRRGRLGDRDLLRRQERPATMVIGLISVGLGLAAMRALRAPADLYPPVVAMTAGVAVALAVSVFLKISIHTACVAGSVVVLTFLVSPWSLLLTPSCASDRLDKGRPRGSHAGTNRRRVGRGTSWRPARCCPTLLQSPVAGAGPATIGVTLAVARRQLLRRESPPSMVAGVSDHVVASVAGPYEAIATFDSPPVAEVVAAVRFSPMSLPAISSVGALWHESLRSRYPGFEAQAPYDAPEERFESRPVRHGFGFRFSQHPPLPRFWLTDDTGHEVLQIQQDWFAANWRKVQPSSEYERWPARREAFRANWELTSRWFRDRGERLTPNQCEVTYINHILPVEGLWSAHADAYKIMRNLGPLGTLPLEQFSWQAQFLLPGSSGEPIGRVHASLKPVLRAADALPMVVLEITARGAPAGQSDAHVLETLDLARNAVVRSFVAITSDEAQEAWGRK